MIGICNQCLEEKELHKKSHIIPDFIFRSGKIYDEENHNLIYFDIETNEYIGRMPSAPYEKYIFCKDCEKYHSAIESRASGTIYHYEFDTSKIYLTKRGLLATQEFGEADPESFKLFLILLLFRASLSNKSSFNQVQLGPYHEKFRRILNEEQPLSSSGCYFYLYNFNSLIKNELNRLCSPIYRMRIETKKAYTLFVAGMGIIYHFNTPTNNILKGAEISGEKGLKMNLITKKKAAEIMLTSTFNLPKRIVKEMLYHK